MVPGYAQEARLDPQEAFPTGVARRIHLDTLFSRVTKLFSGSRWSVLRLQIGTTCVSLVFLRCNRLFEYWGFRGGSVVKNLPANSGDARDAGSIPGLRRFPWSRKRQPVPVFSPEKFHG